MSASASRSFLARSFWTGDSFYASFGFFAIAALLVKLGFLIADPNPQFFIGDSRSYIATATSGWIPPDRSFLYGFIVGWVCLTSGSLFSLVLLQSIVTTVVAGAVGWMLVRFFRASWITALLATIGCAADPIQVMYERYVMAEAFSLFPAVCFVVLIFLYVRTDWIGYLPLASGAGLVAVALRTTFLPPILVISMAAPLMAFVTHFGKAGRVRQLILSAVVIVVTHLSLHTGYKYLNGRLSHSYPAYQYADGFFLISSWAPLITPGDLEKVGLTEKVFEGAQERTLEARRSHRWLPDGIVAKLITYSGSEQSANSLAKKLSTCVLQRHPFGIVKLAYQTYLRGFRRDIIRGCIKEDIGEQPIPPDLQKTASERFHIVSNDMLGRKTVSNSYFARSGNWYRALLLTPFFALAALFCCKPAARPLLFIVLLYAAAVMATATAFAVDNSIRYLHPLVWPWIVSTAVICESIRSRLSRTAPSQAPAATAQATAN